MKKSLIVTLALLCVGVQVSAADKESKSSDSRFKFSIGADLVSHYLWRGSYLGGLSIQPDIMLGWGGLYAEGWWNVGAENWSFQNLNPEMDLTIGFDNFGFAIDLTHFYYFNDAKFLEGNCDMTLEGNGGRSTIDGHIGVHLGDLIESVPLSIDWYTTLWGGDGYIDNGTLRRAYSSFVMVSYDWVLPLDFTIETKVGLTPWKGSYSGYQEVWKDGSVGITDIHLGLNRPFEVGMLTITPYAYVTLNCYRLTKENFVVSGSDKSEQRFNWCIGGNITFGN